MKKKNSIILMLVVLITMFVNVNSVMAKKFTCYYKLSEVNGRENTLEISFEKGQKKITVNGYTNCLMNLSSKDKKNTKKIATCLKKKGSYNFEYDSSCASGEKKYSVSKTLSNVKDCPKKLCVNSKSTKAKVKCTYTRTINTNTYPNTTAESFYLSVDPNSKKVALADKIDECKKNKYNDYAKKICDKINKGEVDYDGALKASKCNHTYTLQSYGSNDGCPENLCLDKYLPKDDKNKANANINNRIQNDNANANKQNNSTEKEDKVAKSLKFENKTGCNLWGGLLDTVKMIFTVIKWFLGVGLVILSMIDFAKAVIGSEPEEDLAKAKKKLTTRIIVLIIIFLVPSILDFLIKNVLDVETCIDKIQ